MKQMDLAYKQIQIMRDLLIEELRPSFTTITVEHMKLVEMRLQTLIMAGISQESLQAEKKNFKF